MTQLLDSIGQIAPDFGAIVLDQWGVLHDGSAPYPGAIDALTGLSEAGTRLAVLSNSGKRADLNAARIASKGFAPQLFDCVMTSGEALWQDAAAGTLQGLDDLSGARAFVVAAHPSDAATWAAGLNVTFTADLASADFVLIMGLPEGDAAPSSTSLAALRDDILAKKLPVFCSNPDRASPRAGGALVTSPGALAHDIADAGGRVTFYGKPHAPVFHALETALDLAPEQILMVGDSLEHDIAGAASAGWRTLFIRGGIHASSFQSSSLQSGPVQFGASQSGQILPALKDLVAAKSMRLPDYTLPSLR